MNNSIFFFFYNLAHRSAFFDQLVIFTAHYLPYIVIILAGIFLLMHHDVFVSENPMQVFLQKKKEILRAFFCGIVAWVIAYGLKMLIGWPRPFDVFPQVHPLISETGFGFPSGHATFFMALAVSIFLSHKKAGYVFVALAVLIGLARIIAGVHFPGDILGGFILGGVIAFFLRKV